MRTKTVISIPAGTAFTMPLVNGAAVPIEYMTRISGQAVVAGATSPSSAAKIQVSDDVEPVGMVKAQFTPANWSDLAGATVTVNANGAFLIPATEVCARWARMVHTVTSGSGGTVQGTVHTLAAAGAG